MTGVSAAMREGYVELSESASQMNRPAFRSRSDRTKAAYCVENIRQWKSWLRRYEVETSQQNVKPRLKSSF